MSDKPNILTDSDLAKTIASQKLKIPLEQIKTTIIDGRSYVYFLLDDIPID